MGFSPDQTNTDGSFQLTGIPAGDYFIIALSRGEDVAYSDAEVSVILKKAATAVHVDKSNIVNLQLNQIETADLHLPQI